MHATINVPESFSFSVPTQIVFKVGAAEGIADQATALGGTRALVVAESGVVAAGIVAPLVENPLVEIEPTEFAVDVKLGGIEVGCLHVRVPS